MSDFSSHNREWRFYISDMLEFAYKALSYVDNLSQDEFVDSGLTYDATIRNLELIGEAATHIPEDIRDRFSDIPWRMMVATRNRLIHAYLGIDNDTVWSIISDDLPALIPMLERIQREESS